MANRLMVLIVLASIMALPLRAQAATVNLGEISDPNGEYCNGLIKLALSYSETPYSITYNGETNMTQTRLLEEVKSGNIAIMWAGTTRSLEEELIPVRIPLYKGLLGHRIFIIHSGNQPAFDNVSTIENMKRLNLGQGRTWSDTEILEANGFNVVKANKYSNLFDMVDGGRFDAFPRGVQEPWAEISSRPTLELAVEKKLMLIYKMPFYLFVSQSNIRLAADLESGLRAAITDGSFDNYFLNNPMVMDVLNKANLQNRIAFHLKNPTLSPKTPLEDKTLWLDPYSLGL